ncbi:MarR family transcriptional regulator [Sulfolobus acidocaldarius]|uniref:Conserved protein n=4 Tax=Sulfolobus acidocaldarius TaxID=2285 RepID=Q4J734_SULAC|nr:helix-turn-helix domain-containing protein [Sulfolobus acidocaldarius]AAY81397.1 conserved protein [Sulfolobus acidocaldarius DSM 639]AGE71996.1 hypothetical protein SacN8_10230 [Sulfolobus acidocaldarius N8]AGE74312.1 hypothetical protein SacRon12I_10480 [Sulfolobus acidocaldarius Ron12/I]ALU29809.1 hypothetical protein ATY89_07570 [Sulfolobus acidocaldarius]ALU32548.1 hypothetical protein ATZ20_10590 [Sulfolobus acidocaldarius]
MIRLEPNDILVLEELILYIQLTSYRFSKLTGISNATAWRTFNRLVGLGLVKREDKRGFSITARGAIILYLNTSKGNVRRRCLSVLKKLWNYDGDEEKLKYFLEDVDKVLKSMNLSPFVICFNQPVTIATMLYNKQDELREETKEVIANILINFFPSIDLRNGCKAIISYDNNGKPYVLAAKCKREGIKLRYYCPEISKYLSVTNAELPQ